MAKLTIRDEIREVVDKYADYTCLYKDDDCESRGRNGWCVSTDASYRCLMKRLGELGVVLRVEKELHVIGLNGMISSVVHEIQYKERDRMLKAGYAAVEPLIDEE